MSQSGSQFDKQQGYQDGDENLKSRKRREAVSNTKNDLIYFVYRKLRSMKLSNKRNVSLSTEGTRMLTALSMTL
jgi:hypothetical protein